MYVVAKFVLILFLCPKSFCHVECINRINVKKFHKIKNCHKSTGTVIARSSGSNITECIEIAIKKRGLAINYSPKKKCEILACPENANSSALIRTNEFDYYSAFSNISAPLNSTCLKSIGLFALITAKRNFTEAIKHCQTLGGDLANIISEERTNGISSLMKGHQHIQAAYVGLDDTEREGVFRTALGASLACFKYRAWAPGQPRSKHRSQDCVVLDSESSWKVVDCKRELPFICELFPEDASVGGGLKDCRKLVNRSDVRRCKENERRIEVLKKASRDEFCEFFDSGEVNE